MELGAEGPSTPSSPGVWAGLWAWDFLNRQGEAGNCLVVAKFSTCNFVWAREIMRTLPHRRCVVLADIKGMSQPIQTGIGATTVDCFLKVS
jgi:hypothetical protein